MGWNLIELPEIVICPGLLLGYFNRVLSEVVLGGTFELKQS
jgi:hypothetical protein